MADKQWRKIGVYVGGTSLLITVLGSVIGMAWGGSSKLTAFEKDIKANSKDAKAGIKIVTDNQTEDRVAYKELAVIVSDMKQDHANDYKELKQDVNDAKLRDARTATQYTQILSHMQQSTAHDERESKAREQIQIKLTEVQVKVETLINNGE